MIFLNYVIVFDGGLFGDGYESFIRFNLSAPRFTIAEVLKRMGTAVKELINR